MSSLRSHGVTVLAVPTAVPVLARRLAAISLTMLGSCVTGPHWSGDCEPRSVGGDLGRPPFTVSRFVTSERTVSVTRSLDVEQTLEDVSAYDMSPQIARELRRCGLRADAFTAPIGQAAAPTTPDALTLSGYVLINRPIEDSAAHWLSMLATLGVMPVLIPSPFPRVVGYEFAYRFDVTSAEGRSVYSSDVRTGRLVFHEHSWGSGDRSMLPGMIRQRVAEIAAAELSGATGK